MHKRHGDALNFIILILVSIIIYVIFVPKGNVSTVPPNISSENFSLEELTDPIQTRYKGKTFIKTINYKNVNLKIYPKANYRIYAMVMSKKNYNWSWDSKIIPYDLALAWNKLMLPKYQKGIRYSQGNRWYYFRADSSFPLSKSYIARHSANTHIIPADNNIKKAIDRIRVKNKIYLEGYLVNLKGKVKNREAFWNSSLTRNDTGDGSCELFYVTKAVEGNKTYE